MQRRDGRSAQVSTPHARRGAVKMAWQLLIVVVPAVLVLGVLNALPQFLGGDALGVVRYRSVEEAEARLRVTLYRPAGVPGPWRWPPARVRYAPGPTDWIEYVVEAPPGAAVPSLVLCQTLHEAGAEARVPAVLLEPGDLLQAGDISTRGRVVGVRRLLLRDGTLAHEAWWRDGTRRVMLRARVPSDVLLRMIPALLGNP